MSCFSLELVAQSSKLIGTKMCSFSSKIHAHLSPHLLGIETLSPGGQVRTLKTWDVSFSQNVKHKLFYYVLLKNQRIQTAEIRNMLLDSLSESWMLRCLLSKVLDFCCSQD